MNPNKKLSAFSYVGITALVLLLVFLVASIARGGPPDPPGGGGGTNTTVNAVTNYVKVGYHYTYTSSQGGGGDGYFFPANWKTLTRNQYFKWDYLSINTNVWWVEEGDYDALCALILLDSDAPDEYNTNTFILATFPSNGVYEGSTVKFTWTDYYVDGPEVFTDPFYTGIFSSAESVGGPQPCVNPDVDLIVE